MQKPAWRWGVFALIALAAGVAVLAGPPLAEHEAIVAQIARQTLRTGHWLIPTCIETPFIIKPPLVPWAAAVASMVLPHDAASGLPVTAFAARLPSILATALTVWLLYVGSRSMFGRRTAWLTAFIYATSIGAWVFAVNATAEAMLTLFCTWAFIEFWWAAQAATARARRIHMLWFYVAFGLAMLAKGPMPLSMVAIPIALHWWMQRPVRMLAAGGIRATPRALGYGLGHAPGQFWRALRQLGLWWGVPLFLAMFLPWMLYVAKHDALAWKVWNVEYVHRLRGDYPGIGREPWWYYLPLLFGLAVPWALSLPEALAAPFLRVYRSHRKPLMYAWFWAVIGILLMSKMSFKKPYYILPSMPACALLLTPVVARFFDASRAISVKLARGALVGLVAVFLVGAIVGGSMMKKKYPDAWTAPLSRAAIPAGAGLCIVGFGAAGVFFLRRRCEASMATIGLTTVALFTTGWCLFGPVLDDARESTELVEGLRRHGVPADAPVWVANRPDTRFVFYGQVPIKPIVDPYRLVAEDGGTWDDPKHKEKVAGLMYDMLKGDKPVYLLMDREQGRQFQFWYNPRARTLFDIRRGKTANDKSDLVVLTNQGVAMPAAESVASDKAAE